MTSLTVRAPFRVLLPLIPRTGIVLVVLFGVVRVVLVLQANVTGSYQVVSLVFVAMIALPWVLLTRDGRMRIGLVQPARWRRVLPAAVAGLAMALTVYAAATAVWGHTVSSPFASSRSRTRMCRRHRPTSTASPTSSSSR